MLVVGGLASVSGGVVGAFVVTAVFELMRRLEGRIDVPGITQIVVALLILLVLYRGPNGLRNRSTAWLNSSGNSQRQAWPPGASTHVELGSSSWRRRDRFG